ncbi:MAG: ABC transporter ATP-binding protein [Gammaproteobacteria bacterium]|nr:ABC transporter ATP-binding protein [Gammaproteobacteria bacterium]
MSKAAENSPSLSVDRLHVNIGDIKILRDLRFALHPGELCAVIGPSGAGKSTLIKALLGIREADEGRIALGGKSIPTQGAIGYVPQDDAVHRTLTIRAALDYAAQLRRPELGARARASLIASTCRQLDLSERIDVRIRRLSGGQRKRVSVALELMTEPDLLILDEPTSGLDPHLESRLMTLFSDIADTGRVVMVATHAMQSLHRCDVLLILVAGSLAYFGPPASALEHFEVDSYAAIFTEIAKHDGETWARRFYASSIRRTFAHRLVTGARDEPPALGDGRVLFEHRRSPRGGAPSP